MSKKAEPRARRRFAQAIGVAAGGALLSVPLRTRAETYPARPVRIVLPFPPGGATDLLARALAERLTQRLNQPFLVENKPGAGTVLASEHVARSAPDGYTILLAASSIGYAQVLYDKADYDPIKSFVPIIQATSVIHVLSVHPSVPAQNVKELIAYLKTQPGKVNYGSTGAGTSTHLETELFKSMAGVDMVHVPYKGSAPALVDAVAGQTTVIFDPWASSGPYIKAGRLRALAVTTARRSPSLPDLPTVAESGVPGYDAMPWLGFMAPAGTPQAIVKVLHGEIAQILGEPELRAKCEGWGLDIIANSPEAFAAFLKEDIAKWGGVIRQADVKV